VAPKPGQSKEQQEAEAYMIGKFSEELGHPLKQDRFDLANSGYAKVDGVSESPPVLCEAWAHIGKVRSAQNDKVMTDALKLVFLERSVGKPSRKVLLLSDEVARKNFTGRSWGAACLAHFSIETKVIDLPEDLRARVLEAQKRQYR